MDRSKTTPLHLAAENGHDRLILLLLENGANIAQEDAYGRNLLELAILRNQVMAFLCVKKYLAVLLFGLGGKVCPFFGGGWVCFIQSFYRRVYTYQSKIR